MAMSREVLANEVRKMMIYEKDYITIEKLMSSLSDDLFVAILEEVILGNLYWSDFEDILAETGYSDYVTKSIELQDKLTQQIKMYTEFREYNKTKDFNSPSPTIGIINRGDTANIYSQKFQELQDDLIYSLLNTPSSNPVSQVVKMRLYNAIENWKTYSLRKPTGYSVADGKITKTDNGKKYEWEIVNPDDILLSAEEFIIPVSEEFQILTAADREYMKLNNMSESTMKAIKSLSMTIAAWGSGTWGGWKDETRA